MRLKVVASLLLAAVVISGLAYAATRSVSRSELPSLFRRKVPGTQPTMAAAAAVATTAAPEVLYQSTPKPTITDAQVVLLLLWLAGLCQYAYRCSVGAPSQRHETDTDRTTALQDYEKFTDVLRSASVFGAIMFYMWLLDDRQILPIHAKHYNRDLFLFICLSILLWASSTVKQARKPRAPPPPQRPPAPAGEEGVSGAVAVAIPQSETPVSTEWKGDFLGREQTEEWKGWMQMGFLLYHYFAAKEYYNVIRVLIASYVWMTGFGNFSYFKKTGDYSMWRVYKMLFRLNFLVVVMCFLMNTDYVLYVIYFVNQLRAEMLTVHIARNAPRYYICPMHTLWFLSVYVTMRIKSDWNDTPHLIGVKMAVYFMVVATVWEIPAVFNAVFSPFAFLLSTEGSMHEWTFRTTLDHWATWVGMIWAWGQPWVKRSLEELELTGNESRSATVKGGILVGGGIIFYLWFSHIFLLPKFDYNHVHPYYSAIPILYYIFVRNMMPNWRKWHLGLLEKAGKITLETYLCQFHIWMCRRGDHYVGALIEIIPGDYHLVNFMLVTAIYIVLSQRLFDLTTVFSSYMLGDMRPDKENATTSWETIKSRWANLAGIFVATYAAVALYRNVMHGPLPEFHFGSMKSLDGV